MMLIELSKKKFLDLYTCLLNDAIHIFISYSNPIKFTFFLKVILLKAITFFVGVTTPIEYFQEKHIHVLLSTLEQQLSF